MERHPIWTCRKEYGLYIIEAMARGGVFRYDVRHAIGKAEFDSALSKKALFEMGIEGMMDEFRKLAIKSGPRQDKFADWPKQKYDTNSITCLKS